MTNKASPSEETPSETTAETPSADGIRPEFKEAMDGYEKFIDDYVDFMKAYAGNDDPLSMLEEYPVMMQQYTNTMTEFRNLDTTELSDEELLYYTEVNIRIFEKIEDIY